jgi:hypothetical protein
MLSTSVAGLAWEDRETEGNYVEVSDSQLLYMGEPFRFVGVNSRSLLWPEFEREIDQATFGEYARPELEAAEAIGARVLRVYLARWSEKWDVDYLIQQATMRLYWLLELAERHDIKLLLCITDAIHDQTLHNIIPGDEHYYVLGEDGRRYLNLEWYTKGYNRRNSPYKKFVKVMAERFGENDGIFGWEIGNEFFANAEPSQGDIDLEAVMVSFSREVGCWLKGCDGSTSVRQLVSTGFISVYHATQGRMDGETIDRFYGEGSPFDYITVHAYNNRQAVDPEGDLSDLCDGVCPDSPHGENRDIAYADSYYHMKPIVFGEAGFDGGAIDGQNPHFPGGWWRPPAEFGAPRFRICPAEHDEVGRAPAIRRTMATFFDEASGDGYMQWNFLSPGVELGVTDNKGMDTTRHLDYDNLSRVYASQAAHLARGWSILGQGVPSSDCVELVVTPAEANLTNYHYERTMVLYSLSNVPVQVEISPVGDHEWLDMDDISYLLEPDGNPLYFSVRACPPAEGGSFEATVEISGTNDSISHHKTYEFLHVTLEADPIPPECNECILIPEAYGCTSHEAVDQCLVDRGCYEINHCACWVCEPWCGVDTNCTDCTCEWRVPGPGETCHCHCA